MSSRTRSSLPRLVSLLGCCAIFLLAGCERLGIETPETIAAAREADGRAVGGACRHAGRALEDCFTLNKKVERAAVFAGWRDMNDYMRENKIDVVAPVLAALQPQAGADEGAEAGDGDAPGRAVGKKLSTSAKH
ncbi:MAG: hypothetical protein ABI564_03745 [Ideonella sp.]